VAASEGSLTVMAGAMDSEIGGIKDLLAPISKKIVPCGGRSKGLIAKLCNNLILSVSMIGVSEAFLIAENVG
jgi:3-hydroxyisobutyrate dehydrogenase